MGRWETVGVASADAGTWTLRVIPFSGSPNNGLGGSFEADVFGALESEPACAPGEWSGSYFANVTVSGEPGLVRCEGPDLDFAWGTGGPGGGLPSNGFSARWSTTRMFEAGVFEFTARLLMMGCG